MVLIFGRKRFISRELFELSSFSDHIPGFTLFCLKTCFEPGLNEKCNLKIKNGRFSDRVVLNSLSDGQSVFLRPFFLFEFWHIL